MVSDEALMLEFQRGSREAFEELFERHRDPLYGFFCRRLTDAARAEELTHDTFMAVIRNQVRYEPRALVRTYLFGIAFRVLACERRKLARERKHTPAAPETPPAPQDSFDSALHVREALARLAAGDREVLMLREFEQLDYTEIALVLEIPLNTVRSRLFRARIALKQQLDPKPQSNFNPLR